MEQSLIFGFNERRAGIVGTVVERVVAGATPPLLLLNDAAYHETRRLEHARDRRERQEYAEWQRLARQLGRMTPGEQRAKLHDLAERYAWDVAGNFDPRVYRVATKLLPPVVTALLSPSTLARNLLLDPRRVLRLEALSGTVLVDGPLEKLRKLAARGTMVYVPTHLSNMDSIVFGYSLEFAGLPPATYGAGKNLFTNPVLSFFMHNLGAYRVDRRIKHDLYKDVLKAYSTVLLERGYHSLFFPGGMRSRSGGVERHLKLGLVGSAMEAYARVLLAGGEGRTFFVPATINYLVTLEAETLIADFLADTGKGRYIIEDDESSRVARVAAFAKKILDAKGAVAIRYGEPIDLFGHRVDEDGISRDRHGREVEPASYFRDRGGRVVVDPSRDAQYTRELGDEICAAYARDTVAMATHLVGAGAFEHLRRASASPDVFAVLRQGGLVVPRGELGRSVERIRDRALELERAGAIRCSADVRSASGVELVDRACRAFRGYHSQPALEPRADGIALSDANLLFYYQNRLAAHGLAWDVIAPKGAPVQRPSPLSSTSEVRTP